MKRFPPCDGCGEEELYCSCTRIKVARPRRHLDLQWQRSASVSIVPSDEQIAVIRRALRGKA